MKDLRAKFKEDQKYIDDGIGELIGVVEGALQNVKGSQDTRSQDNLTQRASPFKRVRERGLQEKLMHFQEDQLVRSGMKVFENQKDNLGGLAQHKKNVNSTILDSEDGIHTNKYNDAFSFHNMKGAYGESLNAEDELDSFSYLPPS
mmetsp:Transcript_38629/g.36983  ORF Transcript_38629/g.36983 Transcript_38629/m.36983 type:complete len:146 (+) Transcript_38629:158-595(+)